MRKKNYLNNKDLMAEIHKSKVTYCSSLGKEYEMYDHIIQSHEELNDETLLLAKTLRAERLASEEYNRIIANWTGKNKPKKKDFIISIDTIPDEEVVVRVMTYEHIPLDPTRRKNPKKESERHAVCNFPPFKHYIRVDDEWKEVMRSHWRGGFHNGEFCIDHGRLTDELGKMILTICEKYAMKGNWRGYCIDEQTETLTQRGWLNIHEISKSDTILSYDIETDMLRWSKIKSIYRNDNYDGLMHKITNKFTDMLVTPKHKVLTERGLVEIEYLLQRDKIIMMGNAEEGAEKVYSDDFVKILGWVLTEGSHDYDKHGQVKNISIYQNPGKNADEIRRSLNALNYEFSDGMNKSSINFRIYKNSIDEIMKVIPDKNLNMELILSLTQNQRELLIETMIKGDGWNRKNNNRSYAQKDRHHIDLFQILCVLAGRRSNFQLVDNIAFGKPTQCHVFNIYSTRLNRACVETLDFHGGKNTGKKHIGKGKKYHPNQPTTPYKGIVWCPETEYGTFVVRRGHLPYITGNSFRSDMVSAAILQLTFAGLKFNESVTQNPFAYFTTLITRSFTTVLNLEKKNRDIRDDLLQDSGYMPSFNRQIEHENEYNNKYDDE